MYLASDHLIWVSSTYDRECVEMTQFGGWLCWNLLIIKDECGDFSDFVTAIGDYSGSVCNCTYVGCCELFNCKDICFYENLRFYNGAILWR